MQPSFGYFIRSPEESEPVALIKSDLSRSDLEKEATQPYRGFSSGSGLNGRLQGSVDLTL